MLAVMALGILVSLVLWVRSFAGLIALPLNAAVLGAFALWGGPHRRMIFAQFIGLALAISTWSGKGYLFTGRVVVDGVERASDITTVGQSLGGPWPLWGALLLVVSLAILAVGLYIAWRKQRAVTSRRRRSIMRSSSFR